MMSYNIDDIKRAFEIYYKILYKGYLSRKNEPQDFRDFKEDNINSIIEGFCEKSQLLTIIKSEYIYIVPLTGNNKLAYTNEELRKKMSLSNNTELYTAYIIMMCIIIKFYNGEEYNTKCRDVLNITELEKFITDKIKSLKELDEEDSMEVNFKECGEFWLGIEPYNEKIVNHKRSNKTRFAFIIRTLYFLKDEGYVGINDDKEFYTTHKFDNIVLSYYPERERKKKILELIKGEKNAQD